MALGRHLLARFKESWPALPDFGPTVGTYALDLGYTVGNHTGAEAIARSDGSANQCGNVRQNTSCVEVAVGGFRYFMLTGCDYL